METKTLKEKHKAALKGSALTDETIEQLGYYTASGAVIDKLMNRPDGWAEPLGDCLVIPYPGTDYAVIRPDNPRDTQKCTDEWVKEAANGARGFAVARGVIEGAMQPKVDEVPRLQARHAAAMNFFAKVKDKNDLDQCVDAIEPEDLRAEFNAAFRAFSQSLDMLLPDPRAMPYRDDMRWLGKIRAAAASRYRDEKLDISDCGAKVRKLIEEAIVADGIQVLVAKVPLFSKEFEKKLEAIKSDEARASTMEHAIRHEIHVKLDENPVFFQSLRERLEQLILDRKAERISAAEQLKLFEKLMTEMKGVSEAASDMGLTDTGFAIYGLLQRELAPLKAAEPAGGYDESTKELASLLDEAIEPHTAIIDWTQKAEVQKEMRKQVKRQLRAAQVEPEKAERLAASIVDLAKARKGR